MEKKDIKSMDLEELTQELLAMGEKKFRAGQIYNWLHVKKVKSFDEMTNLSASLRLKLNNSFYIKRLMLNDLYNVVEWYLRL